MNNVIYLGRDNEVLIEFVFTGDFSIDGLANFTTISLTLGDEVYTTTSTPSQLYLKDDFTLVLSIGDTTSLAIGKYAPEIIGVSSTYDDGYILNCSSSSKIERIRVENC